MWSITSGRLPAGLLWGRRPGSCLALRRERHVFHWRDGEGSSSPAQSATAALTLTMAALQNSIRADHQVGDSEWCDRVPGIWRGVECNRWKCTLRLVGFVGPASGWFVAFGVDGCNLRDTNGQRFVQFHGKGDGLREPCSECIGNRNNGCGNELAQWIDDYDFIAAFCNRQHGLLARIACEWGDSSLYVVYYGWQSAGRADDGGYDRSDFGRAVVEWDVKLYCDRER